MPETPSAFRNAPDAYGAIQLSDMLSVEGEVRRLPPGSPFDEMGGTGLKRTSGVIDEEFLPALKGNKGVQVFSEMSKNDPIVGALLFTIEKLLRQIDWNVVGADQTPEQQEAVEFVEECMSDMSHSWDDLIAEILSMLPFGWAWFETVYKKRIGPWETNPKRKSKFKDGRVGWRKITIRAQETLHRWIFDEDGGIKAMVQIPPPRYTMVTIPIEKSLLFRVGTHKGNPEGVSILRNAYRPWYFKKRLEEFEAIGVERDLAGLPTAKVPSRMMKPNATPDDKRIFTAFKKLVSNVRRDEHEGIVIPSDADPETKLPLYEFELMSSGGSRSFDTNTLIERNSQAILMTVLADFIMVGHQDGGSYALHVDKTGIFRAALNSIAQSIADVFNRYAIPRLFALNGWKLDQLPKLEPSNVDPPNLQELGGFMTQMAGLGMTFFPDPDLEKFLRETAHLPKLPDEVEEQHRMMAEQQNAMDFMQQRMAHQGVADQEQMVADGMTPEQALLENQAPHPDGLAGQQMQAEQDMAMAQGQQKMDIAQQQADLKAQGMQQDVELKGAMGAQDLQLKGQAGAQDLEIKAQQAQQSLAQADAQHHQKLSQMDAEGQQKLAQGKATQEMTAAEHKETLDFQTKLNQLTMQHDAKMKQLELGQTRQMGDINARQARDKGNLGLSQAKAKGKLDLSQTKAKGELSLQQQKAAAQAKKQYTQDAKGGSKDKRSAFDRKKR